MLVSPTDSTLHLLEPHDLGDGALAPGLERHRAALVDVADWARRYLCRPHPALGRDGPVCPYAEASLERGLFWLAVHPGGDAAPGDVASAVARYRDWYLDLEPTDHGEAQYKALLVLFPDLPRATCGAVVEAVQAALKPQFVAAGLMIGQFHPDCDEPALRNPGFRPLRSRVPLLAIRSMVRTDAAFLTGDPTVLGAYLDRFGEEVPPRLQAPVREAAARFGIEYANA
jgi:hypothetical protein